MNVTGNRDEESRKHRNDGGCSQRASAEHEEYAGALTDSRVTENNITNASRPEEGMLEEILSPRNLNRAYKRVKKNKGAGGLNGMSVEELLQYFKDNGEELRQTIHNGYKYVVDMDLEKFFDTVNQSKLIEILSRNIKDGRVISLIHKYLKTGVVTCGRFDETELGVPQGGPLSPLCANVVLNDLDRDRELERRGHRFVRYADDSAPRRRIHVTEHGA